MSVKLLSLTDTSSDDPSDWAHRTVDRPVRNIVKLFHIDETSLMENINQIHEMSKKLLQSNKLSHSETEIPE